MLRFAIITLSAALLVSACGTKSKLTAEQKQELATTMESAGRAQKVAKNLTHNGRFAVVNPRSLTDEQKMLQKLQASTCTAKIVKPKPGVDSSQPLQSGWSVEGLGCPIEMRFLTLIVLTSEFASVKLDVSYKVNDGEYKNWNDVYGMRLAGEIRGNKKYGSGNLTGSISSRRHGEIPMSLSVGGTESHMDLVWTLDFPKFSVELSISGSPEQGSVEYSLNGEKLTPSEFQALLAKGGEAFSTAEVQNPTRR